MELRPGRDPGDGRRVGAGGWHRPICAATPRSRDSLQSAGVATELEPAGWAVTPQPRPCPEPRSSSLGCWPAGGVVARLLPTSRPEALRAAPRWRGDRVRAGAVFGGKAVAWESARGGSRGPTGRRLACPSKEGGGREERQRPAAPGGRVGLAGSPPPLRSLGGWHCGLCCVFLARDKLVHEAAGKPLSHPPAPATHLTSSSVKSRLLKGLVLGPRPWLGPHPTAPPGLPLRRPPELPAAPRPASLTRSPRPRGLHVGGGHLRLPSTGAGDPPVLPPLPSPLRAAKPPPRPGPPPGPGASVGVTHCDRQVIQVCARGICPPPRL